MLDGGEVVDSFFVAAEVEEHGGMVAAHFHRKIRRIHGGAGQEYRTIAQDFHYAGQSFFDEGPDFRLKEFGIEMFQEEIVGADAFAACLESPDDVIGIEFIEQADDFHFRSGQSEIGRRLLVDALKSEAVRAALIEQDCVHFNQHTEVRMLYEGENHLERLCVADLLRQNFLQKNLQIRALRAD